jgi:hypothetical protein
LTSQVQLPQVPPNSGIHFCLFVTSEANDIQYPKAFARKI